jgi:hypothetical protein
MATWPYHFPIAELAVGVVSKALYDGVQDVLHCCFLQGGGKTVGLQGLAKGYERSNT